MRKHDIYDMVINVKKFALILALLLIGLYSCGSVPPEDESETADTAADYTGLFEGYTLVRSDTADKTEIDAAMILKNLLALDITTDWVKRGEEVPDDGVELLVGATNRLATLEALNELTSYRGNCQNDYIIRIGGGKIVVAGVTPEATLAAAHYFADELLPKLDADLLETGFEYIYRREYQTIALGGADIGEYTICVSEELEDDIGSAVGELRSEIYELTGFELPIVREQTEHSISIALADIGLTRMRTYFKDGRLVIEGGHYLPAAEGVRNLTALLGEGSIDSDFRADETFDAVPLVDEAHGNLTLVWNDEFDGEELDRGIWSFEKGYVRNNELQYYNDEPQNARLEDGFLILEARDDGKENMDYTSASINTRKSKTFCGGYFEIRAKLPMGQGIWPAFWMLGVSGGWPAGGEIDILELVGGGAGRDDTIYGNVHWADGNGNHVSLDSGKHSYRLPDGVFNDDFHTFGFEWTAEKMVWYCDDQPFLSCELGEGMEAFRSEFYILLNLAVGGSWPGSPDRTTVFPNQYLIDYIRVYQ